MNKQYSRSISPYLISAILLLMACSTDKTAVNNEEDSPSLGKIWHSLPVSEPSSKTFETGLLYLHSFEYEDAKTAFRKAQKEDSTELMNYWGEAMCEYKALWGLQNLEAGRQVMAKLGMNEEARLEKAENELERDLWKGIEIMYGPGELLERNKKYAAHMENLTEKYPKNNEIAAFYSLSLMWSTSEREEEVYEKSASIAKGILEENPDHPGALHYLIHAYDHPNFAVGAKQAADEYASTAPSAAHALHMPSHIYVAMGMWEPMVLSNESSYTASVDRMKNKELDDAARSYHAFSWLQYGYLQQGRTQDAINLMVRMEELMNQMESSYTDRLWMRTLLLTETESWPSEITHKQPNAIDHGIFGKSLIRFYYGYKHFLNGQKNELKSQIDSLETEIITAELAVTDDGVALCSSGATRYAPTKNKVIRAKVIRQELQALHSILSNKPEEAEENFKMAIAYERQAPFSSGLPDIPYSSFDMYGKWLSGQKKYEEALELHNENLTRSPNRRKSLTLKAEALKGLGKDKELQETLQTLKEMTKEDGKSKYHLL